MVTAWCHTSYLWLEQLTRMFIVSSGAIFDHFMCVFFVFVFVVVFFFSFSVWGTKTFCSLSVSEETSFGFFPSL